MSASSRYHKLIAHAFLRHAFAASSDSFELIDRMKATTLEERRKIFGQTAMSDYFFMSTNAITLNGELVPAE